MIPFLAKSRLERDWVNANIIQKHSYGGVPVEFLNSKKCFEWMTAKALQGYIMYPYAKYIRKYRK
jgi:hypothetical protein